MLEDIMMGLNILPPRVLQRNCDQHHLHGDGRPPVCSSSRPPDRTVPRHCGEGGTGGSSIRCVCSHGYTPGSDDVLAKGTAFHFTATPTTCTVNPNFDVETQPLNPLCCSTCHHRNPLCCSNGPADLAKCDWASCYSAALPCSPGHLQNHEELRNTQNREFHVRISKNLAVACDGGSNTKAIHSGPSLGPLQSRQALPQCQGSLSLTRERDLDPGSRLGSAAHSEVLSTAREYDCPLINGETFPSPSSQANGEAVPSYVHGRKIIVIPQEKESMMSTHSVPSPAESDAFEPQHTGLHFPERFVALRQECKTLPFQPSPPHWEELFLPKCLSPIHSPELPLPPSFVKRFPMVPATPFHRVPQLSKLPNWLCPTMAKLQFPLDSMLLSAHNQGNLFPSKKELLTIGQVKTDGIRSNSQYSGKEESKERIEKIVTDTRASQTLEKPKSKRKERDVDAACHFPATVCVRRKPEERIQLVNSDTTEPFFKKRRRRVSKPDQAILQESPSVGAASLKLKHRTTPMNGQFKIGLCSVSLSSNNILARDKLGRLPFDISTVSPYSHDEEAKGQPKETKRLRKKTANAAKVLRATDGDVKSLPIICTRASRRSSVKLHQEDKKPDVSSDTLFSSGLQTLEKAVGLHQISTPPPSLKRKRGRPRKIRPKEDELPTSTCSVPLVDMAAGNHNSEDIEHKKEKGELKGMGHEGEKNHFSALFKILPTLPEPKTDVHNLSQQRAYPGVLEVQVSSNCSEMFPGPNLESQLAGLPQHSSTKRSGETKSDKDQMSTPAVKPTISKSQAPTVSLKKFKELLNHWPEKTRKSTEREDKKTECGNEVERISGEKLPEPKTGEGTENVSTEVGVNKGSSQSLERNSPTGPIFVEIYNQESCAESKQGKEIDKGPKISTKYHSHSESKRKNVEDNSENADNYTVKENVSRNYVDLAPLAMLSMTKTVFVPQPTDKNIEEVTHRVTKDRKEEQNDLLQETNKVEEDQIKFNTKHKIGIVQELEYRMEDRYLNINVHKEADTVQVHPTFGITETGEIGGDTEKEEVDVVKEEFGMKAIDPAVYPDADPGVSEVDQECSNANAADFVRPTHLDLEPSKLTSSRKITAGSTISWESEEEEVVEVDVLECSPDIQPQVWEAGLEHGSTELTEEDEEDLEEDEIDVTGEETG